MKKIKQNPKVSLAETKPEMIKNQKTVLMTLRNFQIMLIIFSGILAFAVMMLISRMNYLERIRELAKLKVLGFREKEMKHLVLRENIWITLVSLPLGYGLSRLLLGAIVKQATTPEMELYSIISPISIIISFGFILGFTLLVNYIVDRKFKTIDMASSLKSVE